MDAEDTSCLFSSIISFLQISFLIIHFLFDLDRVLHVLLRLSLPETIHPKLSDILPKSAKVQNYPLVAVQLPMLNEIECCETAIACVCSLKWPKSRLTVQVLDDSTNDAAKMLIDNCVKKWSEEGIQIQVHRRHDRSGFKAGSLNSGMKFIKDAEYIAIFDADFLPSTDFLYKTIPTLMKSHQVAFAQARWTFINPKESFLTRMQEINLNFHHKCEQESRFRSSLYFTFNGTGGVWRRKAIEDIGGWHTDTLVEDLDLSLRAYIHGWRSIYMHNLGCLNELPPTQAGYFSQQYRWNAGPMQVAHKIIKGIVRSNRICWYQKLYCVWYLFQSWAYLITFFRLIIIIPLSVWKSTTDTYNIFTVLFTMVTFIGHIAFTPDEILLFLQYILFRNAVSLNNGCATLAGIFNYGRTKEWVVTPKFGTSSNVGSSHTLKKQTVMRTKYADFLLMPILLLNTYVRRLYQYIQSGCRGKFRIYKSYLLVALYLLYVGHFAHQKAKYCSALYLTATSMMYFIMAFGYLGRT